MPNRLPTKVEKRSAVAAGAVQADHRFGAGARAVEQRQHAVVENVEEGEHGGVAAVAQAIAHVLGDVHRHAGRWRPAGRRNSRPGARARRRRPGVNRLQRRWHGRPAPDPGRNAPHRRAGAAMRRCAAGPGGRSRSGAAPGRSPCAPHCASSSCVQLYRIAHAPPFAGQRMISPRPSVRIDVSVNELIDTYWAKNSLSTAPSTNGAGAFEGGVVQGNGDLDAAAQGDRARRRHAPRDGFATRSSARLRPGAAHSGRPDGSTAPASRAAPPRPAPDRCRPATGN